MNVLGGVEWVSELIPGVELQLDQFVVETDEVDDELIEVFVDELRRLTGEMQEGISSGNEELVRQAAHSVKGMGGTIGLPEISVLALTVENTAKESRLTDGKPLVDALSEWLTTIG